MVVPVIAAGSGAAGGAGAAGAAATGGGATAAGSGAARGAVAGAGGTARSGAATAGARGQAGGEGAGGKVGTQQATPGESAAQLKRDQSRQRLKKLLQQATESEEGEVEQRHEPKISDMMMIFGFIYMGLIDFIGIILLFFGLDDFFILDMLAWPMQLYLRMKGAPSTYDLIAQLAEMIPYVGALPLRTVCWTITVWVDRHPSGNVAQATQVAQRATSQISKAAPKANVAA